MREKKIFMSMIGAKKKDSKLFLKRKNIFNEIYDKVNKK